MGRLIDTHAHLDFSQFDEDREETISRARESGVDYIINVGTSVSGSRSSIELARRYDSIYASVGIHPHDATNVKEEDLSTLEELAAREEVVAIGETGLDYWRNLSPPDAQRELFRAAIGIARKSKLPLIIHSRDADEDTLAIFKEERIDALGGVLHCFSGNAAFAKECLDLNLLISVTGNITYPKSDVLREAVASIPLERIMVETDAPFLAPQPKRGKRNEPAFVSYVAAELAKIYNVTPEEVSRITTENAKEFFKLEER